jgi:hypothetical protein
MIFLQAKDEKLAHEAVDRARSLVKRYELMWNALVIFIL